MLSRIADIWPQVEPPQGGSYKPVSKNHS
jgi:hypothetical protein